MNSRNIFGGRNKQNKKMKVPSVCVLKKTSKEGTSMNYSMNLVNSEDK